MTVGKCKVISPPETASGFFNFDEQGNNIAERSKSRAWPLFGRLSPQIPLRLPNAVVSVFESRWEIGVEYFRLLVWNRSTTEVKGTPAADFSIWTRFEKVLRPRACLFRMNFWLFACDVRCKSIVFARKKPKIAERGWRP
jgi:hypothetical protein